MVRSKAKQKKVKAKKSKKTARAPKRSKSKGPRAKSSAPAKKGKKKKLTPAELVELKSVSRAQEKREIAKIEKKLAKLKPATEQRKKERDKEEGAPKGIENFDYTLDRTPMKIYLSQIENIPLLKPEEEIELAEKIQSGHRGAQDARKQMIRSNLRLVISIAKRYSNMGLAFSDLVEEGNIGLMRAVEKFNPERGYRFSTYASWWIKQAIMRALSNQGKTIRIPVYMYDIISRWRRVRDGLMQKLNRLPTRKEIAKIMELPVSKIQEIESIAGRPSSLNAPVSLDGTAELVDLLADDGSSNPETDIEEVMKSERIQQFLNQLEEREKKIIQLRFGLGEDESHTLEEVAEKFGITRERVRQIEAIALKKIRAQFSTEEERLEDYLT